MTGASRTWKRCAVVHLGDKASGDAIEEHVGGDHNATRASLKGMLGAGELVRVGKGPPTRHRLPG